MIAKLWLLTRPPKNTMSELAHPCSLKNAASSLSDCYGRVTSKLMFPYKEDLVRFDFEVASEDEYMCEFLAKAGMKSTDK